MTNGYCERKTRNSRVASLRPPHCMNEAELKVGPQNLCAQDAGKVIARMAKEVGHGIVVVVTPL